MSYIFRRWLAGVLAAVLISLAPILTMLGCWWGQIYLSPTTWGFGGVVGFLLGCVIAIPTFVIMCQWTHETHCHAREPATTRVVEGSRITDAGRVIDEAACDCTANLQRFWYAQKELPPLRDLPLPVSVREETREDILRRANDLVESERPLNWRS